jgi:hypothetical protein
MRWKRVLSLRPGGVPVQELPDPMRQWARQEQRWVKDVRGENQDSSARAKHSAKLGKRVARLRKVLHNVHADNQARTPVRQRQMLCHTGRKMNVPFGNGSRYLGIETVSYAKARGSPPQETWIAPASDLYKNRIGATESRYSTEVHFCRTLINRVKPISYLLTALFGSRHGSLISELLQWKLPKDFLGTAVARVSPS